MDMLSFSWLPAFLSGFWAYLKGVSVTDDVSLYGVLLAVCLLIVAIRGIVLKR
ncbi:Uncharacterised protein [Chlamydia trachomatis]|jgi:hypothetical protein|nr:Uncharacterised protein [Chlamydia trachomatis]